MNLLLRNRKTLLTSALVLVLLGCLMGIWFSHHSKPGAATKPVEQNTGSSAALQTMTLQSPDAPQQTARAREAALPPIPAEMAAEIRRLSNRTYTGLVEEKHADGSVSMDLHDHFQSVTAVVRAPDGTLIIRHGEDFLANIQPDTAVKHNDKTH
jgi:hypothetical protein